MSSISMEHPRLTSYLRAFSGVAAPWAGNYNYDPESLIKKRREQGECHAKLCTLDKVKEYMYKNSTHSSSEINGVFMELMDIAKKLAGSDAAPLVIEGSVVFLLEVFRDCTLIGHKQKLQLRRMFGAFNSSIATRAFNCVQKMINFLDSDIKDKYCENGFTKSDIGLMEEEFGTKIKFFEQTPLEKSFFAVPLKFSKCEKNTNALNALSFKFHSVEHFEEPTIPKLSKPPPQKYDHRWLETVIENSLQTNLPPAELALSVSQLLKSSRSNDELQNELFDLLGFECIDLIQTILHHRNEIISTRVLTNGKESSNKHPSYMAQVTIQSETEKLLTKQIRKDEKKLNKEKSRQSDESPHVFETQHLKQLREQAFREATQRPIFHHKSPSSSTYNTSMFPNVYDRYNEIQMSASFIGGKQ